MKKLILLSVIFLTGCNNNKVLDYYDRVIDCYQEVGFTVKVYNDCKRTEKIN